MRARKATVATLAIGLLLAGAAARAEVRPADPEAFRAEVRSLVGHLSESTRFGGRPGTAEGARRALDEMSPAELATLRASLERIPNWRRLPEVVARLEATPTLAAASSRGGEAAGLERFRADLLVLVERFRAVSPLIADPFFDARLDRLEANVRSFPAEGLPTLHAAYLRQAPAWKARLLGLTPAPPAPGAPGLGEKAIFDSCNRNCGFGDFDCLADEISCDTSAIGDEIDRLRRLIDDAVDGFFRDVGEVFGEIGALPGEIGSFFGGLVNDVEGYLAASIAALQGPIEELLAVSSPADALALLGLDGLDAGYFQDLAASVPSLDLPCPAITDGNQSFRFLESACDRGIEWVAGLVYDVVPDDVLDVPLKGPATFVYYPINYYCLCASTQATLAYQTAQAGHRDWVKQRLDDRLSSRATGISVQALQAGLDALAPRIEAVSASVAAVQAAEVDVDGDVAQIEAKLDVLDPKVDLIDDSQDDQSDLLELFADLELRLDIEEGLLNEPSRTIGAFQAPEAFEGFLGRVREVVIAAIAMSSVAGVPILGAETELSRGDSDLAEGAWEGAFDHYRKAYLSVAK